MFSPYLLYVVLGSVSQYHSFYFPNFSYSLEICYRWNLGSEFLVWYLFLLYVKLHLGQNGCAIRYHSQILNQYCMQCRFSTHKNWGDTKIWNLQVMANLLYYYGICNLLKDCLLYRYFSKVFNILWITELSLILPHFVDVTFVDIDWDIASKVLWVKFIYVSGSSWQCWSSRIRHSSSMQKS